MSDKIGKWLTRDGRTAVVFAEHGGRSIGAAEYGSIWAARDWNSDGKYVKSMEELLLLFQIKA